MDNTQTSQQGPSGLDAYISRVEPQPANIDDLLAVNERDKEVRQGGNDGGTINVGLEGQDPNTARLTNQQAGQIPQDNEVQLRLAEAERRAQAAEQAARKAAADRIEAQNREFEASIAHLSDEDQQWYRLQREVQQTRQVNAWMGQKIANQQQTQNEVVQQNAKRVTALTVANGTGLPQDPTVHEYLMTANSLPEMQQKAQQLQRLMGARNARQVQQQGGFAAGGQVGQAAPAAKPKPYSGDLKTLIQSRSYQVVPQ